MKTFPPVSLVLLCLGICIAGNRGDAEESDPRPDFAHLTTTDGREYFNCYIKKTDAEGLLIEHREGVAKISFFDLSEEIRRAYDFDPIEAMRLHRETRERDRIMRQERILEAEQWKAETARQAAFVKLQKEATQKWIPVEARIFLVKKDGAFARVSKVVFEPTTVISALGFENPGPLKRVTKPMGDGVYFLQSPSRESFTLGKWNGYLEPFSIGEKPYPSEKKKTVPVHLAVPPP